MSAVDEFFRLPSEQILAELRAVRAEKALLDRKEKVLEDVASVRAQQGDGEELVGMVGTVREQIRAIMGGQPASKLWLPREMVPALAAHGTSATLDNVRMTMARMADSGELERPNAKTLQFKLPGGAA